MLHSRFIIDTFAFVVIDCLAALLLQTGCGENDFLKNISLDADLIPEEIDVVGRQPSNLVARLPSRC